ncbi:MAG: tRNA (adenosine(37)-N6)-threonylcarbamoyltransferase complex dimerization subunit type 1 TsaB [bacterium]|nr:tRNA (adenosine(37)-N6)-threonylcarbamoyltransferase complex dimerization subunit type 1 TsaB [bacterium]
MKCLAVNTANTLLTLALVVDGQLMHTYETSETRDQGNLLLQHAQKALDAAGLTYQQLDLLAVVTGPGSFTGIRIGLATMRALAMAAEVPVMGVSAFELFTAQRTGHTNIICVESWREELYFQVNDAAGNTVIPPVNLSPEDFLQKLTSVSEPYLLSGDAAEKLQPLLPAAVTHDAKITAVDAARIGIAKFQKAGQGEHPVPFYLREADVTIAKS